MNSLTSRPVSGFVLVRFTLLNDDTATNTQPGLHFANASVWLSCARTLAVFDITPPVEHGKLVMPKFETNGATIRYDAISHR